MANGIVQRSLVDRLVANGVTPTSQRLTDENLISKASVTTCCPKESSAMAMDSLSPFKMYSVDQTESPAQSL